MSFFTEQQMKSLLSIGQELTRMENRRGKRVRVGETQGQVHQESLDAICLKNATNPRHAGSGMMVISKPCTIEEI